MPAKNPSDQKNELRELRVDKFFQRFANGGALFGFMQDKPGAFGLEGTWLKCIGDLPEDVDEGDDLIVLGHMKKHPKYGDQFQIQFVLASGIGPLKVDPAKLTQTLALRELGAALKKGHCYEVFHTVAYNVAKTLGKPQAEVEDELRKDMSLIRIRGNRVLRWDIDADEDAIATTIRHAVHATQAR